MNRFLNNLPALACLLLSAAGCKTFHKITDTSISSLRFINEFDVPYNFAYRNTTVGGLSGLDYNAQADLYYCISDDRSNISPARFYTAKMSIVSRGIDSVYFTDVTTLQQPGGHPYPNSTKEPAGTCDPEALRYDAHNNTFIWSSEGERLVREGDTVLTDPSVIALSRDGSYLYSYDLPANMHMQAAGKGPRRNGVFEGLAISADKRSLYVSVEEPLYEDGPRAGTGDSSAWVRIIRFDMKSHKPLAQYAYRIDPVAHLPKPPGAFIVNGITDILATGKEQLLVTERSFSSGSLHCTIKLYLANLNGATDISTISSIPGQPTIRPVTKKLLLNMDGLNRYIDNVEGAAFGPRLPNGHGTLILVADNNFNPLEKTQFFLFEINP